MREEQEHIANRRSDAIDGFYWLDGGIRAAGLPDVGLTLRIAATKVATFN